MNRNYPLLIAMVCTVALGCGGEIDTAKTAEASDDGKASTSTSEIAQVGTASNDDLGQNQNEESDKGDTWRLASHKKQEDNWWWCGASS